MPSSATDPDVERWSTYVGRGAIRFYLPLNVELAEPVLLAGRRHRQGRRSAPAAAEEARNAAGRGVPERRVARFAARTRTAGRLAGAVPRQRPGHRPGSRYRAEARADRLGQPRMRCASTYDWMEPARMVRVKIDQDQARLLGLSSQALAAALNSVVTGTTVTQVRDDIYLVDVDRAGNRRAACFARQSAHAADPACRMAAPCRSVQVATFDFGQEYPLIWRRDRVPTLTVQADVKPGGSPEAVVDALDARGRQADRPRCRPAITSPSAARSRRAPPRRPPSWPSCRSCCS